MSLRHIESLDISLFVFPPLTHTHNLMYRQRADGRLDCPVKQDHILHILHAVLRTRSLYKPNDAPPLHLSFCRSLSAQHDVSVGNSLSSHVRTIIVYHLSHLLLLFCEMWMTVPPRPLLWVFLSLRLPHVRMLNSFQFGQWNSLGHTLQLLRRSTVWTSRLFTQLD